MILAGQSTTESQSLEPSTLANVPVSMDSMADARARAAALAAQFSASAMSFPVSSGNDGSDDAGKRKFDGAVMNEEPGSKKRAFDYPGNGFEQALSGGTLGAVLGASDTIMCPGDKVGKIIGRAGATIKELQDRTGTRIQVDHKASTPDKPVTISGMRDDVERCRRLVMELIEGSDAGLSSATNSLAAGPGTGEPRTIQCPQGIVGRIIGRGGETIRSLQQASGAHILINQDFPEGVPRQIVISGKPDAIERGFRMVMDLMNGEPGSATAVVQKYGVGQTEMLDCPKPMVGRIIGKGGETIKVLQKQFNCSIQIDQNTSPCRVTITGPPHMLSAARRAVEDLIGPAPDNQAFRPAPSSGPRPSFPQPSGPYGAFGPPPGAFAPAYPMPGFGGYPGGYPAYPPAFPGSAAAYPAMGAYASFGGFPPQQAEQFAPAAAQAAQYSAFNAGAVSAAGSSATAAAPQPSQGLWQAVQDEQGRTYYYNTQTGTSTWEKPSDMS